MKLIPEYVYIDKMGVTGKVEWCNVYNNEPKNGNSFRVPNEPKQIELKNISKFSPREPSFACEFDLDGKRYKNEFVIDEMIDSIKNGRLSNGVFTGQFKFTKLQGFGRLMLVEVGGNTYKKHELIDLLSIEPLINKRALVPNSVYMTRDGQTIAYFGKIETTSSRYCSKTRKYIPSNMLSEVKQGEIVFRYMLFDDYEKVVSGSIEYHTVYLNDIKDLKVVREFPNLTCDFSIIQNIVKNTPSPNLGYSDYWRDLYLKTKFVN